MDMVDMVESLHTVRHNHNGAKSGRGTIEGLGFGLGFEWADDASWGHTTPEENIQ